MAKVLEELIVIKLSRMIRTSDTETNVVKEELRNLIEETIPSLVEEVINDSSVLVEIAELE